MTDTCDWCGEQTNKVQIQPGTGCGLCPTCCPDFGMGKEMKWLDDINEPLPPQWHFMSTMEKSSWKDGMSIEEIAEEFNWADKNDSFR